jgi:ABC-2 type transport system ATP-binding protein
VDEAEELCDRIAILHRGRVVAAGTPGEPMARSSKPVRIRFSADQNDLSWLAGVPTSATSRSGTAVSRSAAPVPCWALVAAELVARGIVPADLRADQASLEDVYLELSAQAKKVAA